MSALDWSTLALAVVGAATGVAALATQVWGLVLAGPRVRVAAGSAFSPGGGGWLLTVNANNVGRLPVTIMEQGVAFKVGSKWKHSPLGMMPAGMVQPPPEPHRLADGEAVTWVMPSGPLAATVGGTGARKVHAYARLATDKVLRSRKSVDIVTLASMR